MILELSIDFNSSLFEISWLDKNILKKIFLNFLGKSQAFSCLPGDDLF